MSLALNTNPGDYIYFNVFFTRKLKKNDRYWVIDSSFILSPVDGAVSQIGYIDDDQLLQAKNKKYSMEQLLGGDVTLARNFLNGSFATLYLAPHDYHRIHMPVTGRLIKSIYVPGDLFPVNAVSVENVNQLFARNERFISIFETKLGLMAQIMVGAIFVGSMETVWLGEITPTKKRKLTIKEYNNQSIKLNQADEFGHFNMGSTVILLFQKDKLLWLPNIKKNSLIEVGQLLGNEII
jgi:phosphatidylserine decarboxylase